MLKWTTELPTKPGLYLWRAGKNSPVAMYALSAYGTTTSGKPRLFTVDSLTSAVRFAEFMGGEWSKVWSKEECAV